MKMFLCVSYMHVCLCAHADTYLLTSLQTFKAFLDRSDCLSLNIDFHTRQEYIYYFLSE